MTKEQILPSVISTHNKPKEEITEDVFKAEMRGNENGN